MTGITKVIIRSCFFVATSLSARCPYSCQQLLKSKPDQILLICVRFKIVEDFVGKMASVPKVVERPHKELVHAACTVANPYYRMGYSALTSQALAAPPYLVAFVSVLLTSWLSDRWRQRSFFVSFHALLAAIGYSIMAVAGSQAENAGVGWRYAGVYLAATGFFSAITIIITWTINNQESDSRKGTGVAMLNLIGQLGPLIGTHLYPQSDGPYYVNGMSICAIFMAAVGVLSLALRYILTTKNGQPGTGYEVVSEEDHVLAVKDRKAKRRKFEFIL